MFSKKYYPDLSVKSSIIRKLQRTSNEETVRWLDNAHTGLGMNVQEMRKSLTRGDVDQTLVYVADMKMGAVTMLAALEVMEARLQTTAPSTPQKQSPSKPDTPPVPDRRRAIGHQLWAAG